MVRKLTTAAALGLAGLSAAAAADPPAGEPGDNDVPRHVQLHDIADVSAVPLQQPPLAVPGIAARSMNASA